MSLSGSGTSESGRGGSSVLHPVPLPLSLRTYLKTGPPLPWGPRSLSGMVSCLTRREGLGPYLVGPVSPVPTEGHGPSRGTPTPAFLSLPRLLCPGCRPGHRPSPSKRGSLKGVKPKRRCVSERVSQVYHRPGGLPMRPGEWTSHWGGRN